MGVYLSARPLDEGAIPGLATHLRVVEEEFTIIHDGKPAPDVPEQASLRRELKRFEDHEREFGKAGHAAFGLWILWDEQQHPLGAVLGSGVELLSGDVIVSAFDAAATRQLADALDQVDDHELAELFFSSELREVAEYTDVERGDDDAAEEVAMFLEEVTNGPRYLFSFCREHGLGMIVWAG